MNAPTQAVVVGIGADGFDFGDDHAQFVALEGVGDRADKLHWRSDGSDVRDARAARIYDGPDEVHRQAVAIRILKDFSTQA